MGIIRGLRDFFRKVYRQLRRHLSKTELIFGTQEYSCLFDKNCKVCDNHVPDIRRIPDDVHFV